MAKTEIEKREIKSFKWKESLNKRLARLAGLDNRALNNYLETNLERFASDEEARLGLLPIEQDKEFLKTHKKH